MRNGGLVVVWRPALVAALIAACAFAAAARGADPAPTGDEHIVLVPERARDVLSRSSFTPLAEYDAFDLVTTAGEDADRLVRAGATVRDDMRRVRIGGRDVDPLREREPLVTRTGVRIGADDETLAIVQFVGPIKSSWYAALQRSGVRIVTYQAQNAYLVHGTGRQIERAAAGDGLRAVVAYTAADKLAGVPAGRQPERVAVSTLSGGDGANARREVAAAGRRTTATSTVKGLATAHAEVTGTEARSVAADDGVVAVLPDPQPQLLDEASSQILAGALDGSHQPVLGDGYGDFLADAGFPGAFSDFVVDITDSGLDRGVVPTANDGSHPDFYANGNPAGATRVAYVQGGVTESSGQNNRDCIGHGTHVASTATGYNQGTGSQVEDDDGFNYGLGVAPGARLGSTKIFDCSGKFTVSSSFEALADSAHAKGARVSNHSWGSPVRGAYTADSRAFDAMVRDARPDVAGHQPIVEVVAAGNAGSPGGSTASGYDTVDAPGTAKNVITVGASEGVRPTGASACWPDAAADSARDIAPFSSRGPTDDGRQKPDVVAPGTHIISAKSGAPDFNGGGVCRVFPAASAYAESDGTSMATPQVTGAAALIRDWYRRTRGGGTATPSPAMTKALLVNSADDLAGGNEGRGVGTTNASVPAQSQGFGRANLKKVLDDSSANRSLRDQGDVLSASGQAETLTFTVADPGKPVKVALAWTDAPGPVGGNAFVNDLDLEVVRGASTFRGNGMSNDPSAPPAAADPRNNVEVVRFAGTGGGTFTLSVRGTTIAGDGVPGNADPTDQDYALVVSNATTTAAPALAGDGGIDPAEGGDGDGAYEPGERISFTRRVQNVGDAPAPGVQAALSGDFAPLTATAPFPTLGVGAISAPTSPLVARVPVGAQCGDSLTATITVSGAGRALTDSISIRTGAPGARSTHSRTHSPVVAIPDGLAENVPGDPVTSQLAVPAGTPQIGDLDVRIDGLAHAWVGDLRIHLTSPDGETVTLASRPGPGLYGSRADGITGVVFDDDATMPIEAIADVEGPVAPGRYRPDQALARFVGDDPEGVWQLVITDNFNEETGQFSGWSAQPAASVCSNPAAAASSAPSDVTSASARLRGAVRSGGVPTDYRIEYGRTAAYGAQTPLRSAPDDDSQVAFAEPVAGLAPNAEYHYRVVAVRGGSVVAAGSDVKFTTARPASATPTPTPTRTPTTPGGEPGDPPRVLGAISFRRTPRAVRADRKRRFKFRFAGTPRRTGKAVFTARVRRKKVRIGAKRFTIRSNGRATLKLRLSKKNYKRLRKAKKLRVTAKVRLDGRTFSRSFTLRPPKAKKRKR